MWIGFVVAIAREHRQRSVAREAPIVDAPSGGLEFERVPVQM